MAAIWRWRDNPSVIGHIIPEKAIHGLLKRDVVINPGEAGLLLKDGKLEDVVTQTKLKRVGGGFGNWWNRWRGHESGTELLFLTTTPIDLEIPIDEKIGLTTKDRHKMVGKTTIRFQFLQENIPKIINLMERRPLLTKDKLIEKIRNEIIAFVFSPHIAKYTAEDFHGNVAIIKDMETATSVEMRKSFEIWGLHLLKMYTVWGKTAYDELMEYQTQLNTLYKKRKTYTDVQYQERSDQLDRVHVERKKEQEQKWDIHFAEIHSEEKSKDVQWDADLGREERKFESELEMEKKKSDEERRQDAEDLKMALDAKKHLQDMKMVRLEKETDLRVQEKQQDLDFKTKEMEMQTGSTERILSQAIQSGAADSKSLQEMMKQQTMQKALDRESEKVQAISEAEKARYEVETYKGAEDREREYETTRMDLTAKQMEAAKQKLPETLVQGATSTPVITHASSPKDAAEEKVETEDCWNCGEPVDKSAKLCPHCEETLE